MKLKSYSIIALIFMIAIFNGYYFGGRWGLILSFIIALSISLFLIFWQEDHLINMLNCKKIEGQDPWNIINVTFNLTKKSMLPMPSIFILENKTPNIFCLGRNWDNVMIVITTGLVEKLNHVEIEAVLAYELAKIKSQDIFSLGIAWIFSDFFIRAGNLLDKIIPLNWGKKRVNFFSKISYFFALFIIRLIVDKNHFLQNDQQAVKWLSDPKNLASALWKIHMYARTIPFEVPIAILHLFIVNPLGSKENYKYLNIHPSIKSRIKNIVGYYPI